MKLTEIENGIWTLRIGTPEGHTPVSMRKFPVKSDALAAMEKRSLPELVDGLQYRQTKRGLVITLPMDSDEDIYGLGLQLKSVNQAGRKRMLRVNSDPVSDTGEGHAPVPFYVSTAGYGLFIDTYRHVEIYFGTNTQKGQSANMTEVNRPHEEFSESALYALKRSHERRQVVIDIKAVDGVDLYFFSGTVREAVQRYNLFSGGGCLPPMWGLGVWYRPYGGSTQDSVLKLARDFRRDNIPIDVIGIEPGWHSHSYACTYEWSYLFPEPQKMLDALAEQNYKVNLWEHVFVYPAAAFYEKLLPYSADCEVWNGLVPDFATEEAIKLFSDHHRDKFVKNGVAGFKLDECDNSDLNPSNWSFPDTAEFPSGMDGEQMHGALGTLYQGLIYDLYKSEDRRTLSQVRSSGALASPLPFVLYSDLYGHRDFIRGVVTSGFSGLLWSPEVRDCRNVPDLLRRMETVMFSAQALYNAWRIPSPPWKQTDIEKNLAGELMEDAETVTNIIRRYHEVRMSLLPYLYAAFSEYRNIGLPPVRALVMDFEDDLNVRNIDDEYMLGPDLLVVPLTVEDGTSRNVYLPNGTWYDFWDGTPFEGGRAIGFEVPYDKIPVFVRDGAILPLADPIQCVTSDTVFTVRPKIYGDGHRGCTLAEDDFTTFAYEQGAQRRIRLTVSNGQVTAEPPMSKKYRMEG